jgi:uncharacterized protein YdhG (YjbR/CyaY superfamily)
MAKTNYPSVDAYIDAQPAASRPVLEAVRDAIRAALPEATEVISYQIPAYKVHGRAALYFAGWKTHYSIYPASEALAAAFADALEPYELEKGTIRFPLDQPAPTALIGEIAAFRAAEVARVTKPEKR